MPLIKYAQYLFYPGGGEAGGVDVTVTLDGGNVAVPLRADKAGALPLPNPVTTDPDGLLWFYAPPGDYITWFAGTYWPIPVDLDETDPAWPGTFIHEQSVPATGWTVDHWFGVEPHVTVLVDGQAYEADITHPSATQTVITFGAPTGGVAHLRR